MKKMIYKFIRVDSPKYTQDYSKLIVPTMHPPLETTHSPPPPTPATVVYLTGGAATRREPDCES